MGRSPTWKEIESAYLDREKRKGRAERACSLRAEGFSHDLAVAWYEKHPAALSIIEAHLQDRDIYHHGLKPEDLHERKSGRKRSRQQKRWERRPWAW